jgi:catechol 2,3-dioxygenase-like lactoylglutathione lyase family enzyme
MKLNHIDLQVPNVQDAVAFFERWFAFVLTSSRSSPAIAILRGDDGFVLVLQRRGHADPEYPNGFHVGFLLPNEQEVLDFHGRARDGGLEISEVTRNGRGTQVYCYAPGRILVEVSYRAA